MSRLFVVTSMCDEGTDGVDYAFHADSREDVASYILDEMVNGATRGLEFRNLFTLMKIPEQERIYDPSEPYEERCVKHTVFVMTRTPEELLKLCDDSQVDGDSSFKISISEIKKETIIEVKKGDKRDAIVIDTVEDIVKLINFTFKNLSVSHLVADGNTWYPHTCTKWWDRRHCPEGYNPDHDKDFPCYGYWGHNFDANNRDDDGDQDDDVELPYKPQKVSSFDHVFSQNGHGDLSLDTKIELKRVVKLYNDADDLNTDHRGSNHLGIDIDNLFTETIEFQPGTYSVAEFANRAWQVKGNKFDNQYELFCTLNETGVELDNDVWHVTVPVDHGS